MKLFTSKSAYKAVQKVVQLAESTVSKTAFWREIHHAYNIGTEERSNFVLSATDRVNLAKETLAQTGYDPRKDKYVDMVKMSRTQSSKKGFDEKAFSTNPRAPFVEIRFYNGHLESGYRGIHVAEALALSTDLILSIENFDTFVWIDENYLRDYLVKQPSIKTVMLVFRGDTKATPKAVMQLREAYDGEWWHFGDFDPKGLQIAVGDMKSDVIIVPDLQALNKLMKVKPEISDSDSYHKQSKSLSHLQKLALGNTTLIELLDAMILGQLAVCQEPLTARGVNLISVRMRSE